MATNQEFKELALSFPETAQLTHFDKASFKVNNKIFATLSEKDHRACLKLSEIDQDVFSAFDKTIIYPVPNKWGKRGWTFVQLDKIQKETLTDALRVAYCQIAPKRLARQFAENTNAD